MLVCYQCYPLSHVVVTLAVKRDTISLLMTHLRFPWQPHFEFLFVSLVFVATYNLSIKVGDVKGSGTDGNVYIQLFGERGNTAKIQLRQAGDARNKFEKGRTYKFTVDTVDIGKVCIKHY